jgi:hypothetical protein
MSYALEGGLGAYFDSSALAPPNAFTLTRTYNTGGMVARMCTAAVPSCSRDAREVTTSDVTRVLASPTVVAAFGTPTPVFGYDSRPSDGSILVLRDPEGKSLGIGADRPDALVPQALQDVQTVFNRLDLQMRATPACAMLDK